MKRPKSVSIISWLLIIASIISLVSTVASYGNPIAHELMAQSPIPIPLQYVMTFVGLTLMLVCGIMMLKAKNWARNLYVAWSVFGLIIGVITSPIKAMMIPGAVFLGIVAFFLYRPKVNSYFAGGVIE